MSIESILLLALLVFPLLERLTRHLRGRADQASADPVGAPPRQRPPALAWPPMPERAPIPERAADASGAQGPVVRPVSVPLPVLAPLPVPERHPAAERLTAGERVRAGRMLQADRASRERGRGAPTRAPRAVLLGSGPADLRRAVVLTAILGPCKALENDVVRHRA